MRIGAGTSRGALWIPVILALGALASHVKAVEIHVPADQGTIQAAINAATNGDVVTVAPGTYFETINLLGKFITVRSSGGASQTILDGITQGASVIVCVGGENDNTVIQGFTIHNGEGTLDGATRYGLGMFILDSSPRILDCVFEDMYYPLINNGGAIACRNSSPHVQGCSFFDNTANFGGAIINFEGGTPVVEDCLFDGNVADIGDGGAILSLQEKITIDRCVFRNNSAQFRGGAVKTSANGLPTSASSTFNSLFFNNSAADGGAIYNHSGHTTITNCTFADNDASGLGSAIWGESAHIMSCIIWGNGPGAPLASSIWSVDYTLIQGGHAGSGNIDVDPLFDVLSNHSYSLLPVSPAIDAGNNNADLDWVTPGLQPLPPIDLAGMARFADVPGVVDTGVGVAPIVDMGCYEVPGAVQFLRGDSDGDGLFNALADGLYLLTFGFLGGPPPSCLEAADVDGDGTQNALADGLYALSHGFLGGPPPGSPYPGCGPDPDPSSSLGCGASGCP